MWNQNNNKILEKVSSISVFPFMQNGGVRKGIT